MLVLITTADRNFDAGALETLIARRQFRLEPFYLPPKRPSVMILLPLLSLNPRPSTTNTTLGGLDCLLTNMIHTLLVLYASLLFQSPNDLEVKQHE